MASAITADGLVKSFGKTRALDGLDLDVPRGTVLGLLGPNGAGKTTAVRILSTLLLPDEGTATVAGHDVRREPGAVRRAIGLSGQSAAVDEYLSGRENLEICGRLYRIRRKEALARADELLARFELTDVAGEKVKTYSGGMRRRLDLAASLIGRPEIIFLDEPTTGLDLSSRLTLWDMVRTLAAEGTTVLLTTQYLEEADKLADWIAVIDNGKVIAADPPTELKALVGERIEAVVRERAKLAEAAQVLKTIGEREPQIDEEARRVTVPVSGGAGLIAEAVRELDARQVVLDDIALRQPTLDDAFLILTRHDAKREAGEKGDEG
jgi:ABC-2 type transport system ATP-binding protein